jgi:hypothetical protein
MRTLAGFQPYGRFELGDDRTFAYDLFSMLRGRTSVRQEDILHIDLMELKDGLPVNIRVISCTADEMAANCKIITKELFRRINLDVS